MTRHPILILVSLIAILSLIACGPSYRRSGDAASAPRRDGRAYPDKDTSVAPSLGVQDASRMERPASAPVEGTTVHKSVNDGKVYSVIQEVDPSARSGKNLGKGLDGSVLGGEHTEPGTRASVLQARDLGDGAGGEKLGTPRHPREDAGGELERGFTRCSASGGDASTFAVDVDTASFSYARAELGQGRWPQKDALRIEEFINAFRYDYAAPGWFDEHPFRFNAETVACPWNEAHQIVRVGIATKAMNPRRRPAANLVFLIDVSGSMADANKLPLIKKSFALLVDQLGRDDRVAVVTYAGDAGVALEPTPGDERRRIMRCIDGLSAGGSTAGADGIRTAYRLARQHHRKEAANRVILATDGDFNVGETDNDALVRMIRSEADDGIFLTTLGFGMGNFQDRRMERLADEGNGMYAYVDDEREARRLFVEQLPASLVTMAQDVKIQVFFNPGAVRGWRLLGYENRTLARQDFNNDRVDAGEVGAGHAITALYEIVPAYAISEGDPNPFVAGERPVRRQATPDFALRLRLRYQKPGGSRSVLMEHDVPSATTVGTPSSDTHWAMAMAAFAMQLQGSPFRGTCDWRLVRRLAEAGQGGPESEARNETLDLIERAARSDRRRD